MRFVILFYGMIIKSMICPIGGPTAKLSENDAILHFCIQAFECLYAEKIAHCFHTNSTMDSGIIQAVHSFFLYLFPRLDI